jgi:Tfp pilus assembly protein PilP
MRRRFGSAAVLASSLIATACGGGEPTPPPVASTNAPAAPPAPLAAKEPDRPYLPPIAYDARQRRDPFKPPAVATTSDVRRSPALEGFRLVGVMSGPTGPVALVEGADGIGYIVKPGDVLGEGRVTQITGDAVRFAVATPRAGQPGEVTLRLQTH